ncbi:MAG: DUF368 domain-containing protein [Lachnospiraceae bacterium]
MENNSMTEWLLRMTKGIFIGTGFILPGVSGGALAAIFGLYERIISFMAHLGRDFKNNVLFFIPVGIGMLLGIVLLSYPLGYCLEYYPAPTMWLFIGTILGTFPSLWREAGKKGREMKHMAILMTALVVGLAFLLFGASLFNGQISQNFGTWMLAGAIIALGILIPGLSPSNFLLYMGMYSAMVEAFKRLDLTVLVPIAAGAIVCMLLLSKLVDLLFNKAYAVLFHIILGVVIASTLMIIPKDYNYLGIGFLICTVACAAGAALGYWMSGLEEKYKPEKS